MKVFKYWDRETQASVDRDGKKYDLVAWAGSNTSPEEARERAAEKLAGWIDKLSRGGRFGEYEYFRNDIREELIEAVHDSSGNLIAAITRNRYGALILNSSGVLIADVDAEERSFFQPLFSLFGRKLKDKDYRRQAIAELAAKHPELTLAVYETHSGFRVFVLDREFDPGSDESTTLLTELGSDKLYTRLCSAQECYRARLTPKPWRCGMGRPPNDYPRAEAARQREFESWLDRYRQKSSEYAVCRPEATYGDQRPSSQAERLQLMHDEATIRASATHLA
jgi:hypothetical protein